MKQIKISFCVVQPVTKDVTAIFYCV